MTGRLNKPIAILSAAAVFLALLMFAPSEITRSTGFEVTASAESCEHSYVDGVCVNCGISQPIQVTVSSTESAKSEIQKAFLQRGNIELKLTSDALTGITTSNYGDKATELYNSALLHITDSSYQFRSQLGDYIAKSIGSYSMQASGSTDTEGNFVSLTYTYIIDYYTDYEQEDYVTAELTGIYSTLNLSALTEQEKVYKIYNWIASNVSYDYDNLNNEENKTKYTAYGALKDKKAVCQGFAALFYRMCLDNGIDCRIISGDAGGAHAWNIVKVDGKYYYADVTWDCFVIADAANNRQEKPATFFYFLRGTLPNHTEEADSITGTITTSSYSMAGADEYLSAFKAIVAEGAPKAVHLDGNEIPTAEMNWYDINLSESSCIKTLTINITTGISDAELKGLPLFSDEIELHSYTSGKCTVCGVFEDGFGATLAGYTLSLSGNIGVNFYMELSDTIKNDSGAYMQFTLPNGTTEKVMVSVAEKDTAKNPGTTYYKFPCEVAAKEMTAEIKAQMFNGSGTGGAVYTYTVKEYADYILNAGTYDDKTVALVKAMLNYGAYSQMYFNYNTGKLANESLSAEDKALVDITEADLSSYQADLSGEGKVCTFDTAYLTLKSETSVNVYIKLSDGVSEGDVTFTVNDQSVTATKVGERYLITAANIKANSLDEKQIFKVQSSENTDILNYSALTYCRTVLLGDYSDSLKNAVKALYWYNKAADDYSAA
ncbi:MAG: transglutaminase domain-containing protein [Ruminiclostridium sp.]